MKRHNFVLRLVAVGAAILGTMGSVMVDSTLGSAPAGATVTSASGPFTPLPPTRILDTRDGTGAPAAPVGPGATIALSVEGHGGVPASGVSAVVLNVTVTTPTATGWITVYPDGTTRPLASNLNFTAGQTVPNLVIAPVGADGKVDLYNSAGSTQLIADVSGYVTGGGSAANGAFTPLTPTRILDTRDGTGAPAAPVGPGATIALSVEGHGGVPASGVSAVVLNVTVTTPTATGWITVYPDGTTRPLASNLNFTAGQTVPNLVIAPVGADGKVDLYNSAGSTQLIADVSGYVTGGGSAANGAFTPLTPTRILDTRDGTGAPAAPVGPGATIALSVEGHGGVPASGVSAVVLNVTVTTPTATGWITVYPDGTTRPLASNLNFTAGQTVPNLVIAPVGADGKVDLYNSAGSTQLIADVSGYVTGTSWQTLSSFPDTENLYDQIPTELLCPSTSTCVSVGFLQGLETPFFLVTTDGGTTWTKRSSLPFASTGALTAACPSITTCYVQAETMPNDDIYVVYKTTNLGQSWTTLSLPADTSTLLFGAASTQMACPSTTTCIIPGAFDATADDSGFLVTTDGGTTWNAYFTPLWPEGSVEDDEALQCPTTSTCFFVLSENGSTFHALVSNDGGQTWQAVSSPPMSTSQGNLSPDETGFLTCPTATTCNILGSTAASTYLVTTTNAGATWSQPSLLTSTGMPAGMACTSATTCYAAITNDQVDEPDGVLATADGWATSTEASFPADVHAGTNEGGAFYGPFLSCPATSTCFEVATELSNTPDGFSALLLKGTSGSGE